MAKKKYMDKDLKQELEEYSEKQYMDKWKAIYNSKIRDDLSETAKESIRREAQRNAVDTAFVSCLIKYYPKVDEKTIWDAISKVHKLNVANLGELGIASDIQQEVYDRCISAHQSWIKASGHSFERFIANLTHPELTNNGIKFILQSELTRLIKEKKLSNTKEDIVGLQEWGKDFDLYAVQTIYGHTRVFGCIQSKTSIRDRIGRDRTFSENAMDALFWSVAVSLLILLVYLVPNGGSFFKSPG